MVVGTFVMLLAIAYDVYKTKLEETASLAQPSMEVMKTDFLETIVKESQNPDSAKAAAMLQGMQVRLNE